MDEDTQKGERGGCAMMRDRALLESVYLREMLQARRDLPVFAIQSRLFEVQVKIQR
jgi:hypothetical protein